jgi:hypothetical protein
MALDIAAPLQERAVGGWRIRSWDLVRIPALAFAIVVDPDIATLAIHEGESLGDLPPGNG